MTEDLERHRWTPHTSTDEHLRSETLDVGQPGRARLPGGHPRDRPRPPALSAAGAYQVQRHGLPLLYWRGMLKGF